MTRISSYNQFYSSAAAITDSQANLAKIQEQASTQKVAGDLKGFGSQTGQLLSAKAYADRLERRLETINALKGRADVEAAAFTHAADAVKQARDAIGTAVSTQNAAGLRATLENVLSVLVTSANTRYGDQAVFGGIAGDADPFVKTTLDNLATAGTAGADSFWSETGAAKAVVVEDGRTLKLGETAETLFRPLVEFIRDVRIWENGNAPLTGKLTTAQSDYLKTLMPQIAQLQSNLTDQQGIAGITAKQIDDVALSVEAQRDVFSTAIDDQENVNLAEVATKLAAAQTQYQASASIFSQMRNLNLLQYLT
ncbi:MAG: hypothetical protein RL186_135 [Pseudomonadota bacterium]|jgi:flagellar hook-associated protein 3 FlgL